MSELLSDSLFDKLEEAILDGNIELAKDRKSDY